MGTAGPADTAISSLVQIARSRIRSVHFECCWAKLTPRRDLCPPCSIHSLVRQFPPGLRSTIMPAQHVSNQRLCPLPLILFGTDDTYRVCGNFDGEHLIRRLL